MHAIWDKQPVPNRMENCLSQIAGAPVDDVEYPQEFAWRRDADSDFSPILVRSWGFVDKVLLSTPARSAFLVAALSLFVQRLSRRLSQHPLPLRPSFLGPPLSLPSPCFSAFSPPLSFFLSARVLLFAQFQRLFVGGGDSCLGQRLPVPG